jgi:hypothetical protein
MKRSSKLDAVNKMLMSITQAPIPSLSEIYLQGYSATALTILDMVSREIQAKGYHFNTEFGVELKRDTNNKISVPQNALFIDADQRYHKDKVTIRGDYLYILDGDIGEGYTFKKDIKCEIIYLLEFNDIPEVARQYIIARACAEFSKSTIASTDEYNILLQKEEDSRVKMNAMNISHSDVNMINFIGARRALNRIL